MNLNNDINDIRDLIAKNNLKRAVQKTKDLLKNTQFNNEAILQSSRFNDILEQIRMETIDFSSANISKNKIRSSLLGLLSEIEGSKIEKNSHNTKRINFFRANWKWGITILIIVIGFLYFMGQNTDSNNVDSIGNGNTIVQGDEATINNNPPPKKVDQDIILDEIEIKKAEKSDWIQRAETSKLRVNKSIQTLRQKLLLTTSYENMDYSERIKSIELHIKAMELAAHNFADNVEGNGLSRYIPAIGGQA